MIWQRIALGAWSLGIKLLAAHQRRERERLPRCNFVMNAEEVRRFPRLEELLCGRTPNHDGEHCGIDTERCDYEEHNDRCGCVVFKPWQGTSRCECGGFR